MHFRGRLRVLTHSAIWSRRRNGSAHGGDVVAAPTRGGRAASQAATCSSHRLAGSATQSSVFPLTIYPLLQLVSATVLAITCALGGAAGPATYWLACCAAVCVLCSGWLAQRGPPTAPTMVKRSQLAAAAAAADVVIDPRLAAAPAWAASMSLSVVSVARAQRTAPGGRYFFEFHLALQLANLTAQIAALFSLPSPGA